LGQLLSFYGEMRMNINGGVAFLAHIGGFVAGAVAMPVLNALVPHPEAARGSQQPEPEPGDRWPLDCW
jgi:membrane associated rhomboid family serine protease